MRTWTKLVPAVLLAMLLTLAPVHADSDQPRTDKEKIADLQKELADLKKEVETLKRGTVQDIRDIKDMLQRLTQQQPVVSRSGYTPGTGGAGNGGAAMPGTSRVTLRNRYHATATIHVNGQRHTVPPYSETIVANVPLGPITYDVYVEGYGLIHPASTVPLNAGGRDINVFPIQP